jgi:exodeoxyribonuclease V beta subunit
VIRLEPLEIDLVGTSLIEASAGTGKTFTIATLFLRLLLERELRVSEILVLTYTRAATSELRKRIRQRISDALCAAETDDIESDLVLKRLFFDDDSGSQGQNDRASAVRRLSMALADFDEAAILTIHGFCQRVLRENAFESRASFDLTLLVDQDALILEIVADYWAQSIEGEPEAFIRYLANRKTNIDSLVRLARRASAAETPELIPESISPNREQFAVLEKAWSGALAEVRRSWKKFASEIISLLHRAALERRLKNGSYKPAQVSETYSPEMDRALAEFSPGFGQSSKAFMRFTPAKLASGTSKGNRPPEHPFFDACGDLCAADEALCSVLEAQRVELERRLIEVVARESRIRKEHLGQQSYDDLLRAVACALNREGGQALVARLGRQYRVAMIDEFQDTDRLQYQILRSVWHRDAAAGDNSINHDVNPAALFLIGDPKQAIYGFRGADVYVYLMAKADAGDRCFTLATNWRSDPSMVLAVNTLFAQVASPFGLEGIPFDPASARPGAKDELEHGARSTAKPAALEILFVSSSEAALLGKAADPAPLSQRVAGQIAELLRSDSTIAGKPVGPHDIAVLCRTNGQTEAMCRELRRIGIPAALLGSASVFETEEAVEMGTLLAAIAAPGSAPKVRAALATRVFGQSGETLEALQQSRELDPLKHVDQQMEEAWDAWLLRFGRWHKVWLERGFIQMFHQLLREARVHARLLGLQDGERRLTNFLHLAELVEQAILAGQLGPRAALEWLARVRGDRSFRDNAIGDAGELRLESDADAVKIVTLHKSKGLEYPIVYCPFLWAGASLRADEKKWVRFHELEGEGRIVLDLGSDAKAEHQELASAEVQAESVRLLYVALTRAKHRCYLVWGNFPRADSSPLTRLLHPNVGRDRSPPVSLAKMDDDEIRGEIQLLIEASEGSIGLSELGSQTPSREAPPPVLRELASAPVTREISLGWRHSSFSALSASESRSTRGLPRTREEGLDYDAVSESPDLGLASGAEAEVMLNGFPAGAAAGTMLHSILEHLDFEKPSLEQSRDIVGEALELHGFESSWHSLLCRALDRISKTRWSKDGPALADLPVSRRLDELEFLLPVASRGRDDGQSEGLSVADLSGVFKSHAGGDFQKQYAERLDDLQFEPLSGYLKGFIDLVFEWKGRFYLVDYKSNHLGPSPANYAAAALEAAMFEHHYVLQYHLYTVALDRYLALRVPGYDYERHFGGAYYLFLRGMDPDLAVGCGVYFDRPTRAFVAALSGCFADPPGAST